MTTSPSDEVRRAMLDGFAPPRSLLAIGAEGVLTECDLVDLRAGTRRVAVLMGDGRWHTMDEIKAAAGEPGKPASEGLRRLRALREIPGVSIACVKQPGSKRTFIYRLVRA
jgi:hypothetical protein